MPPRLERWKVALDTLCVIPVFANRLFVPGRATPWTNGLGEGEGGSNGFIVKHSVGGCMALRATELTLDVQVKTKVEHWLTSSPFQPCAPSTPNFDVDLLGKLRVENPSHLEDRRRRERPPPARD